MSKSTQAAADGPITPLRINDMARAVGWHGSRSPLPSTIFETADVCQEPNSTAELAAVILRYITSHPEACDTLQGVSDWWLARQRYTDARTRVAAALEFLLDCGQVEALQGPDGRVLYRAVGRASG